MSDSISKYWLLPSSFQMTARISLGVTSVGVSDSDYTVCALRITDPTYYGSLYQVNASSVSCTGFTDPQTLTAGDAALVSNSYFCPTGSVLTQNTNMCGRCLCTALRTFVSYGMSSRWRGLLCCYIFVEMHSQRQAHAYTYAHLHTLACVYVYPCWHVPHKHKHTQT